MKNRCYLLLLFLLINIACENRIKDEQDVASLRLGFIIPPLEARPRALWDWVDGNFDLMEITREMEEAVKMGMGGFDIWDVRSVVDEMNVVPAGPPFMSEKYVKAIVHAINEAERLNLDLGIVIASGWNAGGAWTKPEHQTMGIYRSYVTVEGPGEVKIDMPFPEIPEYIDYLGSERKALIQRDEQGLPVFYTEIAVTAIPLTEDSILSDRSLILDMSKYMDDSGLISWIAPEGNWLITRYVCSNTGQPMFSHTPNSSGPMIDHFNPEASEVHIKYFIDKIEAEMGKPIGESGLSYFYTDSYEVRGQLWTPAMTSEFKNRMKYSIIPFLPVFDGFVIEDEEITERFMYDYNKVLSDLIIENHYQITREICEEYGVDFAAEAAGPGQPVHNCPFESLKSSGVLSFPRGEFWHLPDKHELWRQRRKERGYHYLEELQVIKGVASASHIYNQKYVEAEAFTGTHLWSESPGDLKPTADRAFCEGLNRIIFHTFPHTPVAAGEPGWVYAFGTLVNETRIWWPKVKPWMDYLGRCSYLLQQGNFVGDVLYYYGDNAPNFVPAKHIDPSLGFGYDYDVTNSDVLLNKLYVENSKLKLANGQVYEVLVLPERVDMMPEVLEKIKSLVEAGAIVIGPKPEKSNGLFQWQDRDERIKLMADVLWGDCDGETVMENQFGKGKIVWGKTIREILIDKGVLPDFDFVGPEPAENLDFIHRNIDGIDIYFIWNKAKKRLNGDGLFRVSGKTPEFWNPVTGEMNRIDQFSTKNKYVRITLNLDMNESIFVIFHPGKVNPELKDIKKDYYVEYNPVKDPEKLKEDSFVLSGSIIGLKGPWKVFFPEDKKGPGLVHFDSLISWPESEIDGIRFFSGIASYETEFELKEHYNEDSLSVYIDLGRVRELAEVYINKKSAGITWYAPFRLDITDYVQYGTNHLRVEVANTWANRLAGDAKLPESERMTHSNVIRLPSAWWIPMQDIPNKEFDLMESGLLGPVSIMCTGNVKKRNLK